MRAVVQRVSRAAIRTEGTLVAEMGAGLLVLVGVAREDGSTQACDLAERLPVNHDGDGLARFEIHARPVGHRPRAGIDFNLAIDQIDDPVDGDAAPGIGR